MHIIQRLFNTSYLRNIFILITGTSASQLIQMGISPVLTRLYTPQEFGTYYLFSSIASFLAILASGQYENALILPKRNQEALNLLYLTLFLSVSINLIVFLLIYFSHNFIIAKYENNLLVPYLLLIPVTSFLSCIINCYSNYFTRTNSYKIVSSGKVSQTGTTGIIQISLGGLKNSSLGLIGGSILGQLTASLMFIYLFLKDTKPYLSKLSAKRILVNAKIYKNFPLYNVTHSLSDGLRIYGLVFLISYFFNAETVGEYSLSLRILQLPIFFIATAISQVFYKEIADKYNQRELLWPYTKNLMKKLTLFSIPIFALLAFVAPTLFSVIFGKEWEQAGRYSQILLPWMILSFIGSPISTIPQVLHQQKKFFLLSLGYNLMIPVFFFIGIYLNLSFKEILLLISLQACLFYSIKLKWIINITKNHDSKLK